MYRTHTAGELTLAHVGQTVTLSGWVRRRRDHGGLIFIDIADRYGSTQVVFDPQENAESHTVASSFRSEYVVQVTGVVRARPQGMQNADMTTGSIELVGHQTTILTESKTPPFEITDAENVSEEVRFRYRYLDLRRPEILSKVAMRAQMNRFVRNWFSDHGFLEVQTPVFTVSSPEGARDFLIPSRLHPGKFYALPQSPQQYKQLLMVGGVDKYFQIAPCFRDEDPRADRHSCEFYQIDCEMSFVEQEDVFAVVESFLFDLVAALVPHKKIVGNTISRLSHHDAFLRYGTDKPDLRFGVEIVDVASAFGSTQCALIADALTQKHDVRAMHLAGHSLTRKQIDELTAVAQAEGAKGLAYLIFDEAEVRGSLAKALSDAEIQSLKTQFAVSAGSILFFGVGKTEVVCKSLGAVRLALRDMLGLASATDLAFTWVTDFPFFELDSHGKLDFAHNPFSYPLGGLQALESDDLLAIRACQYDLALNGYEILSGSIRNHDPRILLKAFECVGRDAEEVKARFGAMYEAFQYGAPPHGGFGFGFDRLMMIFLDQDNIRDIYAFPKSGKAQDLMMQAPNTVYPEQLEELHLRLAPTATV